MKELLDYYPGDYERHGFILDDQSIVELRNVSERPEESFLADPEETILHCDRAVATWHTHPGQGSNLSTGDHENFLNWPTLDHFIVGLDGVSCYSVINNKVLRNEEKSLLSRAS